MESTKSPSIESRSRNIKDDRPLVTFLYVLMRDFVQPGNIEAIVMEIEDSDEEWVFSNGWLAQYAQDISERLGVKSSSELA